MIDSQVKKDKFNILIVLSWDHKVIVSFYQGLRYPALDEQSQE